MFIAGKWAALWLLIGWSWLGLPAVGQRIAKYGADFLAGGVGGRALGMGGAYVALATDVDATYWNPAGLSGLAYPEVAYMHAERFAGIVSFDYAALAWPLSARSTLGIAFFRSGVNDIKNTLNAWDPVRNRPRPQAEAFIETFSAVDYAFYFSYARLLGEDLTVGLSAKVVRRAIGDFAEAWGYSVDAGVRYRLGRFWLGVNVQDLSTMLQSWSINADAFALETINPDTGQPYTFEEAFGQELPKGGTYLVLPVLRTGLAYEQPLGLHRLVLALDVDVAFDGQRAYAFNVGDVSLHPRLGAEFWYREVVALRGGINRLAYSDRFGLELTPTVGAGIRLRYLTVDYSFGDFAGLASELGFAHRLAVRFVLVRDSWHRPDV
ncbi:MAG: hypothetical protein Q9M35_00120 [Rhodothermus sp.]|nr:hypothetical protein [Rhodothermus sp.]